MGRVGQGVQAPTVQLLPVAPLKALTSQLELRAVGWPPVQVTETAPAASSSTVAMTCPDASRIEPAELPPNTYE